MILRLTTQNFRNLAAPRPRFTRTANIVVGRNGQGKTNLLEAIYFLATTKSFRTTRIASVVPLRRAERLRRAASAARRSRANALRRPGDRRGEASRADDQRREGHAAGVSERA